MVKPLLTDRPTKVTVSIPESVFNQVHLVLLDPLRARTKYGTMSRLVTTLFREWLDEKRKDASDDGISATVTGLESESLEGGRRTIGRVRDGTDSPETDSPNRSAESGKGEDSLKFT